MEGLADIGGRAQSAIGVFAFLALPWLLSERKAAFPFGFALACVGAQIGLAFLMLNVPVLTDALRLLNGLVLALAEATDAGTAFVFGHVGAGDKPYEVTDPGLTFTFAFRALPLVIFVSALSAALWHWGVLKAVVKGLAFVLERGLRIGGAVSLAAAANAYFGQTEAPLLIRPFLAKLTRSELFAVMTTGLATVAGSVIVLYATILTPVEPSVLGHIIVASLISVPAALLMARIMIPPAPDELATDADAADDLQYDNVIDAYMTGVTDGLKLYLNIIASLIAFIALAKLVNIALAQLPFFAEPLTLETLLGWVFFIPVWLAGVPFAEAQTAGSLMGVKTALNEVIAYLQLAATPDEALSERSRIIMIYALCGFANVSSLGIQIGGFSVLAPERRSDIIALAPRALVAGTLATLMTGAVVGIVWTG
ncbi:MAG: nucleoside transporter C-terminal domain-containing protein [Pseudomonadota bacterium]